MTSVTRRHTLKNSHRSTFTHTHTHRWYLNKPVSSGYFGGQQMYYYIRAVQGYSCHGAFTPGATQGDGVFNDICLVCV